MFKKQWARAVSLVLVVFSLLLFTEVSTVNAKSMEGKLVIWWATGDRYTKPLKDAVQAFNKKYPKAEIRIEYQASPDYYDKLQKVILGGNPPDVVRIGHTVVQALGNQKKLMDLNSFNVKQLRGNFLSTTWEANMYKDKVYALPYDANTTAMMYNKDIFSAAGISTPPKTYDELKSALRKIKARGYSPYTVPTLLEGSGFTAFTFTNWVARNGGSILNSDWTKGNLDSPAAVNALKQICELAQEGFTNKNTFEEGNFYTGKVGVIDMGSWNLEQILPPKAKAKFGVVKPVSLKDGVPAYSTLGLYSLGIVSKTKNKDLAYEFIKFLATDKKTIVQFAKNTNTLPSLKEGLNDPYFNTTEMKVYKEQLNYTVSRPGTPAWPKIERYIQEAVEKAVLGRATPEEALKDANKKINKELSRVR